MKKRVSILVPCFNEEDSLSLFYNETKAVMDALSQYDWELLFINDGSIDHTLDILKKLYEDDKRVSYIDLTRNFGKENAMLAGFDYDR